ncbi:hypothetical protein BKA65DRAFT_272271 [Rhexocercosporidium sp. MPI-PUGE-AT-0058]|nr:hypothetical protein BKA65DRAFT_272271 [Rhexocercosporidium sp. MPI-PUGE-AT-0058]
MTRETFGVSTEAFGRSPVYIVGYGIHLMFISGATLAKKLGRFLVLRLLSGMFSSVKIGNVDGTIAVWELHDTGPAMCYSIRALAVITVAAPRKFHEVLWTLLGISVQTWIILTLIIYETR